MGSPPAPVSPDADGVERWLRESRLIDLERVPWGSNAVFQARLDTPAGELMAIYKPARGERPLWDFPTGTLHRREVATSTVDRALGWNFTPTTVLRADAPLGPGSLQEFIPSPGPELVLDRVRVESSLRGMAALDVLINNADRKQAHLLVDQMGALRGIDHGVTFHPEFKLRTALMNLGGTLVPSEWLEPIEELLADEGRLTQLRRSLRRLLRPVEIRAFEQRAQELLASRTYPILDEWFGRPFEW